MASVLNTHEYLDSENERKSYISIVFLEDLVTKEKKMFFSMAYEHNNMLHKDITAPIYGNIEIWKSALKIVPSYNQQLVSFSFVNLLYHKY